MTTTHITEAGERGMQLALVHADSAQPGWTSRAYSALCEYARTRSDAFTIDEMRSAVVLDSPPEARAWGAVVQRAARDGVIRRVGFAPAVSSHGSPKPLWLCDGPPREFPMPAGLPAIPSAPLPDLYKSAQTALKQCERVDECKDWADKARALASYARQSQDRSLFETAQRIAARAVRRSGELLSEMEHGKSGRPAKTRGDDSPSLPPSRYDAGAKVGMSRDQVKDAVRVASIPAAQFEVLVEAPNPPTTSALAEIGTQRRSLNVQNPEQYKFATQLLGSIADLHRMLTQGNNVPSWRPAAWVASGVSDFERFDAGARAIGIARWLTEFADELKQEDGNG